MRALVSKKKKKIEFNEIKMDRYIESKSIIRRRFLSIFQIDINIDNKFLFIDRSIEEILH